MTYWEGFRVAGLLVFLTAGGSEQLGYALPHQTQGGEGDEKHEQVRGLEFRSSSSTWSLEESVG